MLVISRKAGDSIILGNREVVDDDVVIKVLKVGRNAVRLGIEAPRNILVQRQEVWVRIQKEEEARECT